MRTVEFVVVGAGPGGLCAARTLAAAGREVLVLERKEEIGPKVCAGGLSPKASALLDDMGLPREIGRSHITRASIFGEKPWPLDVMTGMVRTVSRRVLGQWQAADARRAGAEIRTGAVVSGVDVKCRRIALRRGEEIAYEHLIGADGSNSQIRRALGLPHPRRLFAVEYNIPDLDAADLLVRFDSPALKSGYFWIFPHDGYTSIGCGADRSLVPPQDLRGYLDDTLREGNLSCGGAPLEGYPIECAYAGIDFGRVHLVGDAAGLASPVTGEGIYAALISGRDVALSLLDPHYRREELRRWLRLRSLHARIAALWRRRQPRLLSYRGIRALCRDPKGLRAVTALFVG